MSLLGQLNRAAAGGGRRGVVAAVAGLRAESTAAAAAASVPADILEQTESIRDELQRERLQAALAMPKGEAQDLELFRLHNSSLPYNKHMVYATVTEISRRQVNLHTGLRPTRLLRSEISSDGIVGTTRSSGEPRKQGEVRIGDILKVYLDEDETPEGDSLVSSAAAASRLRVEAVWKELEGRQKRGETVKGRILNQLGSGYSVGVAGLVAFLPAMYCAPQTGRRVGELQEFKVMLMNKERMNVTLSDARVDVEAVQEAQRMRRERREGASGFAAGGEVRQTKLEILRTSQELRQVLELRDSGAAAGSVKGEQSAAAEASEQPAAAL